jgi:hypothetical protein
VNWNLFAKFARPRRRRGPRPAPRCRPGLLALEDRTVPSVVTLHEVQSESPLTLSGTIGGVSFAPQGANSLTTTYFGDFLADIDEANLAIKFIPSGNDFCAADTGSWAPRADGSSGTSTAIYGLQADLSGTLVAALRDFHLNADTQGAALPLYFTDDGAFGFASNQTIAISAGTGTYAHPTLGHGAINLSRLSGPNQAGDGWFFDHGRGNVTLTVPINLSVTTTIGGLEFDLNLVGQMVGVGTVPPAPPGAQHSRGDRGLGVALAGARPLGPAPPAAAVNPPVLTADLAPAASAATAEAQALLVRPAGALDLWVHHHAAGTAFDQLTSPDATAEELGF